MEQTFGQHRFTHICPITPVTDDAGAITAFMPQARYANRKRLPLNAYGTGPFCRFRIPTHLNAAGVYILTVADVPYYVGECANLARRYNMGYGNISPRNCFQGGQMTNCRLNNLIYTTVTAGRRVDLWLLVTDDRFAVEHELIAELGTRQHWNRMD